MGEKLTWPQRAALLTVEDSPADLRKVSDALRHRLVDLGMMEPPLVDVDADRVFITPAGRSALKANT